MADQQALKSHIVPKVYLKNFTKANGKLFKLRTDQSNRPRPKEVHPSEICYQKGFYKFSDTHPVQNYSVEDVNILETKGFLYENRLGKLIDKIINSTKSLPIQEALDLSMMLVDIKARNSYMRRHAYSKQLMNTAIDELLTEHEQYRAQIEPILQSNGSSFERLIAITEGLRYEWTKNEDTVKDLHNLLLLEGKINPSSTNQLIVNKLARGKWLILKTTINYQFITSDNPGYCHDQNDKIHNTRFIDRVAFFFPLTPYYLLIIIMEGNQVEPLPTQKVISHGLAEVNWVQGVNQTTWQMANKEVYAAYDTSLLQTRARLYSSLIL